MGTWKDRGVRHPLPELWSNVPRVRRRRSLTSNPIPSFPLGLFESTRATRVSASLCAAMDRSGLNLSCLVRDRQVALSV